MFVVILTWNSLGSETLLPQGGGQVGVCTLSLEWIHSGWQKVSYNETSFMLLQNRFEAILKKVYDG